MYSDAVLKVGEAAKILRISRDAAYAAVHRGELPSIRIGKRVLIPREPFEKMLGIGQSKASSSI